MRWGRIIGLDGFPVHYLGRIGEKGTVYVFEEAGVFLVSADVSFDNLPDAKKYAERKRIS